MALRTAFTDLFSIEHPIALAPMGGCAGGGLAAAVCQGGGLGLVGGGRCDADWLDRELALVTAGTQKPWGVGFQSWAVDVALIERALAHGPKAVMLSFGDPRPLAAPIRRAGSMLIVQVTDLRETRQAIDSLLCAPRRGPSGTDPCAGSRRHSRRPGRGSGAGARRRRRTARNQVPGGYGGPG
jgi:nitronate monooxygenase